MSCLGRAAVPVKRVWRGLSARLRLRRATGKSSSSSSYAPMDDHRGPEDHPSDGEADMDVGTGLGRLRKEVRTCEYSDVHVMWEMLSSSSSTRARGGVMAGMGSRRGRGRVRVGRKAAAAAWSRLASYCCAL